MAIKIVNNERTKNLLKFHFHSEAQQLHERWFPDRNFLYTSLWQWSLLKFRLPRHYLRTTVNFLFQIDWATDFSKPVSFHGGMKKVHGHIYFPMDCFENLLFNKMRFMTRSTTQSFVATIELNWIAFEMSYRWRSGLS